MMRFAYECSECEYTVVSGVMLTECPHCGQKLVLVATGKPGQAMRNTPKFTDASEAQVSIMMDDVFAGFDKLLGEA